MDLPPSRRDRIHFVPSQSGVSKRQFRASQRGIVALPSNRCTIWMRGCPPHLVTAAEWPELVVQVALLGRYYLLFGKHNARADPAVRASATGSRGPGRILSMCSFGLVVVVRLSIRLSGHRRCRSTHPASMACAANSRHRLPALGRLVSCAWTSPFCFGPCPILIKQSGPPAGNREMLDHES